MNSLNKYDGYCSVNFPSDRSWYNIRGYGTYQRSNHNNKDLNIKTTSNNLIPPLVGPYGNHLPSNSEQIYLSHNPQITTAWAPFGIEQQMPQQQMPQQQMPQQQMPQQQMPQQQMPQQQMPQQQMIQAEEVDINNQPIIEGFQNVDTQTTSVTTENESPEFDSDFVTLRNRLQRTERQVDRVRVASTSIAENLEERLRSLEIFIERMRNENNGE